ncbi:hypothetical protein E5Q_01046 [Mixia osmundae IAM 14324]|uniref:Uncharacterized protein n=1 Tax=Mixia osmundae (strain CBS 9802 / IAM 14324 / JCM 22182 / KY 12970) TaxID=764103 RepID=G7DUY5_MIXOS|nr:hypothetical protein E5Q_01046 [Mixia osmundae IAM 14324]
MVGRVRKASKRARGLDGLEPVAHVPKRAAIVQRGGRAKGASATRPDALPQVREEMSRPSNADLSGPERYALLASLYDEIVARTLQEHSVIEKRLCAALGLQSDTALDEERLQVFTEWLGTVQAYATEGRMTEFEADPPEEFQAYRQQHAAAVAAAAAAAANLPADPASHIRPNAAGATSVDRMDGADDDQSTPQARPHGLGQGQSTRTDVPVDPELLRLGPVALSSGNFGVSGDQRVPSAGSQADGQASSSSQQPGKRPPASSWREAFLRHIVDRGELYASVIKDPIKQQQLVKTTMDKAAAEEAEKAREEAEGTRKRKKVVDGNKTAGNNFKLLWRDEQGIVMSMTGKQSKWKQVLLRYCAPDGLSGSTNIASHTGLLPALTPMYKGPKTKTEKKKKAENYFCYRRYQDMGMIIKTEAILPGQFFVTFGARGDKIDNAASMAESAWCPATKKLHTGINYVHASADLMQDEKVREAILNAAEKIFEFGYNQRKIYTEEQRRLEDDEPIDDAVNGEQGTVSVAKYRALQRQLKVMRAALASAQTRAQTDHPGLESSSDDQDDQDDQDGSEASA